MFHEFKCSNCGERFEFTRKSFGEDLPTECPKCGGSAYQVFDSLSVLWKGKFRWMKGEPEVDFDKIDAEYNKQKAKEARAKIAEGLKKTPKLYVQGGING